MLFGLGYAETISLPRKGVLGEVFVATQLASTGTENLTSNIRDTEHIQTQAANTKVSLINSNIHTKYT